LGVSIYLQNTNMTHLCIVRLKELKEKK